jgi:hypothetical protein
MVQYMFGLSYSSSVHHEKYKFFKFSHIHWLVIILHQYVRLICISMYYIFFKFSDIYWP